MWCNGEGVACKQDLEEIGEKIFTIPRNSWSCFLVDGVGIFFLCYQYIREEE